MLRRLQIGRHDIGEIRYPSSNGTSADCVRGFVWLQLRSARRVSVGLARLPVVALLAHSDEARTIPSAIAPCRRATPRRAGIGKRETCYSCVLFQDCMAQNYWCEYCERKVPKSKEDATFKAAALYIIFGISGLFTCGITWLFMIFIPFIQIGAALQTKCPICKAKTRPMLASDGS